MKLIKYFSYFLILVFIIYFITSSVKFYKDKSNSINLKEAGDRYYEKGNYKNALEHYLKTSEDDKYSDSNQNLMLKIAMCYFYNKDFEKCLKNLKESSKFDSQISEYIDYFSLLCYRNLRDSKETKEKINEFFKKHKESLLINDVIIINAECLIENGQYSNSNKQLIPLLKNVEDKEKLQKILIYISDNYFKLKEYDNAVTYLKKIINDYPFEPNSVDALGKIIKIREIEGKAINDDEILLGLSLYISRRNYQKAYEFYKKYSPMLQSKKVDGKFEEGRILFYLGRYDDAFKIFKRISSKYPNSELVPGSMLFAARCYLGKGDIENSIKEYIIFTRFFPRNDIVPEVFWKIGWIYEGMKDFNNAIKYYRINAQRYNKFSDLSLWRIGFCYYKMKRYQSAISIFNNIINKKNINQRLIDSSLYWKAKSLEKLGDIENSKQFLEILASADFPNYYSFKAEEKLKSNIILNDMNTKKNAVTNKLENNMDRYPEIKKGIIVGEIFGMFYGEQILNNVRSRMENSLEFLKIIQNAYEDIRSFSKAIRISIAIKNGYDINKLSEDFEFLIKKVYPKYFEEEALNVIKDGEIEPAVVYSMMRRESAFESDAISIAGAVGLMQLLPENGSKTSKRIGREFVWEDLIDPEINILLGYEHFKSLLEKYDGNYVTAFASYNGGAYNVDNWVKRYGLEDIDEFIESIEFTETREYVKAVLEGWWIYKRLYGDR